MVSRIGGSLLRFPAVMRMTKQEIWVLFIFLVLLVSGLAGKMWLRMQPPRPLAPLPGAAEGGTR
jgi:hypothetical protein